VLVSDKLDAAEQHFTAADGLQVIPQKLSREISGAKHHLEYLEWIIARYDGLHAMNWFLKGTFPKCMNYQKPRAVNVTAALEEVRSAKYAFKSFGEIKIVAVKSKVRFGWDWHSEVCEMMSRYVCQSVCSSRGGTKPHVWWNRGTTYAISGERIRTLRQSEYRWLHDYVSSIVPGSRGVKRRFVLERIWQVMLGCPQDALRKRKGYCAPSSSFPSGNAVAPPKSLIARRVVQWPPPTEPGKRTEGWFLRQHNAQNLTFAG